MPTGCPPPGRLSLSAVPRDWAPYPGGVHTERGSPGARPAAATHRGVRLGAPRGLDAADDRPRGRAHLLEPGRWGAPGRARARHGRREAGGRWPVGVRPRAALRALGAPPGRRAGVGPAPGGLAPPRGGRGGGGLGGRGGLAGGRRRDAPAHRRVAPRQRAPGLDPDQGQGHAGSPGPRRPRAAGAATRPALRPLARWGAAGVSACDPRGRSGCGHREPAAHPTPASPRQAGGATAREGARAPTVAGPPGEPSPRHPPRHGHQRSTDPAPRAACGRGHGRTDPWPPGYHIDQRWAPLWGGRGRFAQRNSP